MLCYVFWSQVEYGIVCFILKVARGPEFDKDRDFIASFLQSEAL